MKHQTCRRRSCLALLLCSWAAAVVAVDVRNYGRTASKDGPKVYIIQTVNEQRPMLFADAQSWYESLTEKDNLVYRYDTVVSGFAARLTPQEAQSLSEHPGILSVRPDRLVHLHTTHTPVFLGLTAGGAAVAPDPNKGRLSEAGKQGQGVIVAVIDTGVWPESRSFHDEGMPPAPKRWKGRCDGSGNFTCNNKIIGARYYSKGFEAHGGKPNATNLFSARDSIGHGSHTASTIAGSPVHNASIYGFAKGTASGMAPRAWLAIYKVCWPTGCYDSDITAAVDDAVADGVDLVSMSLGGETDNYYDDGISVGAFGAVSRGIFVAASASNGGPFPSTVQNMAPWFITVAASTVDRNFPGIVTTGNGDTFRGQTMYSAASLPKKQYPLIYGSEVALAGAVDASYCGNGTLDSGKVQGKIVVCNRGGPNGRPEKGVVVKAAGGAGMVLVNMEEEGEGTVADLHVLPAVHLGYNEGLKLKQYLNSTASPTAYIDPPTTTLGYKPAPAVATFSSRGPNTLTQEILKPDITAPGVNILAAYTKFVSLMGLDFDNRFLDFNVMSGTSMSCPHVSGIAALLKVAHPDWSPAAIRSAMMTSAYVIANDGQPITDTTNGTDATPYLIGAGHVDPDKALDPGLVYDAEPADYVQFLCNIGYSSENIRAVTRQNETCGQAGAGGKPGDLNYPSVSAVLSESRSVVTVRRTVTNVVAKGSVYRANVTAPAGVKVTVTPTELEFGKQGDRRSFNVTLSASVNNLKEAPGALFGSITWSDGSHVVRIPVVVSKPLQITADSPSPSPSP